ncbi:von Willebrand factor type A domain-containing protein [Winogradskyella sp. 3972H.M.0a.05]|uniref:YfbK domain-containing protein n=1 Tax=Winogradskyella sp. 3972H.M.0a.05 TaxID=2950277 RepID=UPI003398ED9A
MKTVLNFCLIMLLSLSAIGQEKTITGVVTSAADGLPLPGANIIIKGTSNGTQSDFDGKYEIKAKKGDVLVYSFVGLKTEEVVVRKSNIINVAMEEDAQLEEVVVVAYGYTTSSSSTNSVTRLRDVTNKKRGRNKLSALNGRVAGLRINGQPGTNNNVIIRGNGSVSGGNEPLYILNGKPVSEKKINGLNTKRIKHIEVLKGAQGTAVYGNQGANGVIVIRTKGKKNNTDVSILNQFYEELNNESYAEITENKFERTQLSPLSTFSIDVDKASYSNVRRLLNNGQRVLPDAVKIEEMINYFDYDYPQPTGKHPFSINSEVSSTPWNPTTKLVKIGLQGKTYKDDELPPSNLTFLIDVSGSMSSSNKLGLLKPAFKLLVNQLREQDNVSIVVYAGAAGVVLEPTSGNQKEKILNALDGLRAGGSTAGGEGIKLAYKLAQENFKKNGNNRVILATDGDFNVGPSSDKDMEKLIEEKRKSGVFLSVLGFGYGNYKDSKLETLADKGNGNHAYIDTMQEARKVFGKEFGGTLYTIAKDVKIQVEFNPNVVQAYRLIGYENRLLADEDFIDDTKDAGELGSGHKVTALYELIPVGIKSSYLEKVHDLKYTDKTKSDAYSDELFTVKFRYKKPDGKKSIEMVHTQDNKTKEMSKDLKFSSAVALFGMQLRKSKYYNGATLDKVVALAKEGKGLDKDGYRSEFIRLVESYNGSK